MPSYWPTRYSQRAESLTSSAIRELLKLTQRPEVISFAGGLPAAELFPKDEFEEAASSLAGGSRWDRPPIQHDGGIPSPARDDRSPR